MITSPGSRRSSCSQIRMTAQPSARSIRRTALSRSRLRWSFSVQNALFVSGTERHFRHPCQKHPSMNAASRLAGNTKSGRPGSPRLWPILHPRMPDLTKYARSFHSVDFVPRDLLALMTRERVARLNLSKTFTLHPIAHTFRLSGDSSRIRPFRLSASACRLINSGGRALPMSKATG